MNLCTKGLVIFLIVFCSPAFSIINQAKLWGGIDISGSLFDSQNFLYEFSPQTRTDLTSGEYQSTHTDVSLGYKVLPNLSLWQGYTSILPGTSTTQNNFWQQIVWELVNQEDVNLENRTRIDERRRVGELQWSNRLREKILLSFPNMLFHKLTPIIYDEIFFNLNHPVWVDDQTLNQNRAFIGIRVPVIKNTTFDIGYLNQYVFQNKVNEDNHIIYLNLNILT